MLMRAMTIAAALAAGAAQAQQTSNCAPYPAIAERLASVWRQAPVAIGSMQENILQIFAATGGSWTALVIQPDGIGCIVASGDNWATITVAPEGDPS